MSLVLLMFLFLNILYHKTYVDNVYFVLHNLNLKESELFYHCLILTQEVTFNPVDFVTIFKVLHHFHVRPKPAHMHFRNKGLIQ